MKSNSILLPLLLTCSSLFQRQCCDAFVVPSSSSIQAAPARPKIGRHQLNAWGGGNDKDEAEIEEEQRLKIFENRRGQIRQSLKAAENLRTFRIKNGKLFYLLVE
jgi:hypothetical protein